MRLLIVFLVCMFPTFCPAQVAEHDTFLYDGAKRDHYIYLPENANKNTPLIVALHGLGGNAKNFRFGIGLTRKAAELGLAVVYPQGIRLPQGSRHWNAGFDFSDVDDLGYLDTLIRHIQIQNGFSAGNLFILGISNGGYMAYRMACHSKSQIKGIISVAATMSRADWQNCPSQRPLSLLHIHGIDDPKIHYEGAAEGMSGWKDAPPVPALVERWADIQNAVPVARKTHETYLTENRYRNDTVQVEIQMIAIKGYGHDWPDLSNGPINALDYIVDFIERIDRHFAWQ